MTWIKGEKRGKGLRQTLWVWEAGNYFFTILFFLHQIVTIFVLFFMWRQNSGHTDKTQDIQTKLKKNRQNSKYTKKKFNKKRQNSIKTDKTQ